jgi:hypothetical protein
MRNAAALVLFALAAADAAFAQQPAPTPISEHVVVPSLPDQPNKEGVVRPTGAMQSDPGGYVRNDAVSVQPGATPGPAAAGRPAAGPGIGVPPAAAAPTAGPHGKPVIRAETLTIRGVVRAYEKGVSITIAEANGRKRTVPLAEKASVYEGVAVGDRVVLRVPLKKPADGKHADRVQKQKPPQAPPPSKFSPQESPRN